LFLQKRRRPQDRVRSAARQTGPLGSYFQTAEGSSWGPQTGDWVCFYRLSAFPPRLFVPQHYNPATGFVFSNLPKGPRLGHPNRRLGCFYKTVGGRRIGFVAQRGKQPFRFVFPNLPNDARFARFDEAVGFVFASCRRSPEIEFVAQRDKPTTGFVFSNLPDGSASGNPTSVWSCFCRTSIVKANWLRCERRNSGRRARPPTSLEVLPTYQGGQQRSTPLRD
jgi:hypothetical protein